MKNMGCYEISLGDTIGIGTTEKTFALLDAVKVEKHLLAAHFHNTYDRAIENLVVALASGISVIDSSCAGIGGCPYANGATGNVATEDVLFLLDLLELEHGVDVEKLMKIGDEISMKLNRKNEAHVTISDYKGIEGMRKEIFE